MDNRYTETFNTWNKIAALYQAKFMDLEVYNETYDFICQSITTNKPNLLEIGCGPGNITKYLLSRRPDFQIFGIDVSPNMIELAKKNNPTASFGVMDCRQIDHIKTKYDGIICGFCLPYLSHVDSQKLLADCYHLLNDHGLIYLSFVEGDPSDSGYKSGSGGDKTYFYYYRSNDLIEQLQTHHFNSIKVFKVRYQKDEQETETHIILTATKTLGFNSL